MKDLINLFRSLYYICTRSEKHEVVIDEETLKYIYDKLKELDVQ